jgi:glucosamine--fructose-6-phosphate aminotransferase (isomerizing)
LDQNMNQRELKPASTLMYNEAAEASTVVARQIDSNNALVTSAVKRILDFAPRSVATMARGSSDHAATYAKYLIETRLGLLTASAAPSVASIYQTRPKLDGTLYIAFSQSGKSPDLLANVKAAKASGALTLAMVNVEDSPLAQMVDIVLPLGAGPEKSVAATKSYIATLSSILHLVAGISGDASLNEGLSALPEGLARAWELDWSEQGVGTLKNANNMFVIGRGLGLGVAQEAALKFKETSGLHAEAYSSAEVKHGPMAIVNKDFPLLVFGQQDETRAGVDQVVSEFLARGAKVLYAADGEQGSHALPVVQNVNPAIEPILAVQSFYRMANAISIARGYNPDEPPHLNKVTETL